MLPLENPPFDDNAHHHDDQRGLDDGCPFRWQEREQRRTQVQERREEVRHGIDGVIQQTVHVIQAVQQVQDEVQCADDQTVDQAGDHIQQGFQRL